MTTSFAADARRAHAELADRLGIDGAFIDRLVDRFYTAVRADPVLAPIFAERIEIDDWPPHLARMKQFWSAILRADSSFRGNPMLKHVTIPRIEEAEFERWLALFGEAVRAEATSEDASALVTDRARAIAASLLAGVRRYRLDQNAPQTAKGTLHA